jgi:hypothetical protein
MSKTLMSQTPVSAPSETRFLGLPPADAAGFGLPR